MIIIIALIVLVPALIGVLFYERFKGYELILRKRVELFFVFAFIINLAGYVILWLRNWTYVVWTAEVGVGALTASFVVQYMVISAVVAVVMAYGLTLVRVEKRKSPSAAEDETLTAEDETSAAEDEAAEANIETEE